MLISMRAAQGGQSCTYSTAHPAAPPAAGQLLSAHARLPRVRKAFSVATSWSLVMGGCSAIGAWSAVGAWSVMVVVSL